MGELPDEVDELRARIDDLEAMETQVKGELGTLRERTDRYQRIFDYSNDAIFVFDPAKDQTLDANPAACNMLGYSPAEIALVPISAIHPEEMPLFNAFAQSVFDRGHGWTNELTCTTKSGHVLPAEISASTVDVGGSNLIIAMIRDITERRRSDEVRQELAVLEERNRLAREIHDTLAQGLTGIIWQLNAAESPVTRGGQEALERLRGIRDLVRECLREARRSVWDLRTGLLQGRSLAEALREEGLRAAAEGGFHVSFSVFGQERVLPGGVEAAILRICQESLANAIKHAQATEVTVALSFDDAHVRLSVRDNGKGFDPAETHRQKDSGGFGLINMRERAQILGGALSVQSDSGQGTLVEATISLE